MHKFLKWSATGFNIGFIGYAPGTFGTLEAVILVVLTNSFSIFAKFIIFVVLFILGIVASEYYQHYYEKKDPGEVVIDEIAAYYLLMIFFDATLFNLIISFLLFRLFDIWKPYPIRQVESKVEGGVGVMIDDILAAIYSFICMVIVSVFV